ncbi:hypothetical protein TNCV_3979121 [Trichonephila clavipes]|nr:hypothetical protein TNCV_3979121 [Trichonephila clavipes]
MTPPQGRRGGQIEAEVPHEPRQDSQKIEPRFLSPILKLVHGLPEVPSAFPGGPRKSLLWTLKHFNNLAPVPRDVGDRKGKLAMFKIT